MAESQLSGAEVGLAAIVLSLAPFLSVLDLILVNIILPHIAGGYGATPSEATLIITFFSVARAGVCDARRRADDDLGTRCQKRARRSGIRTESA